MNRIEELKDLHLQSKPLLELFLSNVRTALVEGSTEKLYRIVYGVKDVVISYDSVIDELFQEIDHLREALEWYATPYNYSTEHLDKYGHILIDQDGGKRAQEALRIDK